MTDEAKSIEEIFKPDPRIHGQPRDRSDAQVLQEADSMRFMVQTSGFSILEDKMCQAVHFLQEQLMRETKPDMINYLKGEIHGINCLRDQINETIRSGQVVGQKLVEHGKDGEHHQQSKKERDAAYGYQRPAGVEEGEPSAG